jgi:thiol-disulfide isomerase/thioredoxin
MPVDAQRPISTALKPEPLVPPGVSTFPSKSGSYCQFDLTDRRLHDFQLPDTQGRMVTFRGLDSDLVLLDFWGTWCAPCRKSIPHLNELQKTLGGKKLQVIGIACEDVPAQQRAAKVAASVKELQIGYPVLVSSRDGTCPVQDAFQIQFYPTMVLLDREGRILRREQGATDATLARIDRFIARNLNAGGGQGETAQLARRTSGQGR